MSVKKEIFKKIGERLVLKLVDLDGLPNLQLFDKQMGQFENPELSVEMPLPCILLEFGQFKYTTIGHNQQKGDGSLKFHIYFENNADSATGSTEQELALRFFEFTEAAHKALQGFSIAGLMSSLERTTDIEDAKHSEIINSIVDYNVVIYDNSADDTQTFVDVEPEVEVEHAKISSRQLTNEEPLFLMK